MNTIHFADIVPVAQILQVTKKGMDIIMEGPIKGIIGIAAGGIIAVMLAVIFKKEREVFSVYINIMACIVILIWGLSKLEIIIDAINKLQSHIQINKSYVSILIKIIGITYVTEFSASICKDSGYHAIGEQIELVGKLSILAIGMPIMLALLDTILSFLTTNSG